MASLKSLPASERFEEDVRQFCLTGLQTVELGHDSSDFRDPFVDAGVSVFFYERNIYTPVGQKEIDGFLATDRGFFVVECKNVSGAVTGTLNAAWQVGREHIQVPGSGHSNPLTQIKNRIGPLASFLRDRKVPFFLTGMIVFPDDANLDGLAESGTISIHEPANRDHSYVVTCVSRIPEILAKMPPGVVSAEDAARVAKLLGLVVPDAGMPERRLRFPVGGFEDLSILQNQRLLERKVSQIREKLSVVPAELAKAQEEAIEAARSVLAASLPESRTKSARSPKNLWLPAVASLLLMLLMFGTISWYFQNRKEVQLIKKQNEAELLPELVGKDPEASPYAIYLMFYGRHPQIPMDTDLLSLAYPLRTREKANADPAFRKKFRERIDSDLKLVGTLSRFKVSLSATLVRYDSRHDRFFLTGILPVRLPGPSGSPGLFPSKQIGVAARLECAFCDAQVLLRDWPLPAAISPRGIFFSFPYPQSGVSEIIGQAPCTGCGLPVHVNLWISPQDVDAGRTSSGKPYISLLGSVKVLSIVLDTDGRELYRKNPPSI